MRASRLLSILLLLQARGRMTARALALEFHVSVRTIYRDVDDLSATGVPIYAERGPEGGFELVEGYRTRLTGLTAPEAESLFLLGLPGPAADLGLGQALMTAQLKLNAALPDARRRGAERVASRFHLDPTGWYSKSDSAGFLPALSDAVWNARRIRARYASWTKVANRTLEPLGLVLKAGIWYLAALGSRQRPGVYRVSSFRAVDLTDESFIRPEGFNLADFWAEWRREFEARLYKGQAELRISREGMKRLDLLASAVSEMSTRAKGDVDEKGWAHITIPIESVDHAAGELLKLGPEAEVLGPPALRQRMAGIAAQLNAIYRPNDRVPTESLRRTRDPGAVSGA